MSILIVVYKNPRIVTLFVLLDFTSNSLFPTTIDIIYFNGFISIVVATKLPKCSVLILNTGDALMMKRHARGNV